MSKECSFEWNLEKEKINLYKHGIDFATAAEVFKDPQRKLIVDSEHSRTEERLFCIGKVQGKILTVRFTWRGRKIRIIGAGYWRKGASHYEK